MPEKIGFIRYGTGRVRNGQSYGFFQGREQERQLLRDEADKQRAGQVRFPMGAQFGSERLDTEVRYRFRVNGSDV